jgi:hypothetical protein
VLGEGREGVFELAPVVLKFISGELVQRVPRRLNGGARAVTAGPTAVGASRSAATMAVCS